MTSNLLCNHGNWVCQPDTDHKGQEICRAQALWDDMHRGDPTAGVDMPLDRTIALGKFELTTSQGPTVSVTYDTETGERTEHPAIPDSFDEYAGGRSVYRSGFLGAKHVDHVREGDNE